MLVFDIETYKDTSDENYIAWKTAGVRVPSNYKDPVKIAEYVANEKADLVNKFGLSPLTGKIILIGVLTDNEATAVPSDAWSLFEPEDSKQYWMRQLALPEHSEKEIISEFWDIVARNRMNDGEPMITYNGKQFDLPYLLHRSAILGIQPRFTLPMNKALSKYDNSTHLDLFNWFGSGSLVEWSYRLGLTNSLQRDGGEIGGWYEAGQIELIKGKNAIDLFQCAEIYKRVRAWL